MKRLQNIATVFILLEHGIVDFQISIWRLDVQSSYLSSYIPMWNVVEISGIDVQLFRINSAQTLLMIFDQFTLSNLSNSFSVFLSLVEDIL